MINDAKFDSQINQENEEKVRLDHRNSLSSRNSSDALKEEEEGDLVLLNAWCEQLDEKEKTAITQSTLLLSIKTGLDGLGEILAILAVS